MTVSTVIGWPFSSSGRRERSTNNCRKCHICTVFFAVIAVNRHRSISVVILSMLSVTYNNIMIPSVVKTSSLLWRGCLPHRVALYYIILYSVIAFVISDRFYSTLSQVTIWTLSLNLQWFVTKRRSLLGILSDYFSDNSVLINCIIIILLN